MRYSLSLFFPFTTTAIDFLNVKKNKKIQQKMISIERIRDITPEIIEYMAKRLEEHDIFTATIIGKQGCGKSTLAKRLIGTFLNTYYPGQHVYLEIRGLDKENLIENVLNEAEKMDINNAKCIAILLEDFSYSLNRDTTSNKIKNLWTQLRHVFHEKKILSFVIGHHFNAVPPILRACDIIAFMSLDEKSIEYLTKSAQNVDASTYIKLFLKLEEEGVLEIGNKKIIYEKDKERLYLLLRNNYLFLTTNRIGN